MANLILIVFILDKPRNTKDNPITLVEKYMTTTTIMGNFDEIRRLKNYKSPLVSTMIRNGACYVSFFKIPYLTNRIPHKVKIGENLITGMLNENNNVIFVTKHDRYVKLCTSEKAITQSNKSMEDTWDNNRFSVLFSSSEE